MKVSLTAYRNRRDVASHAGPSSPPEQRAAGVLSTKRVLAGLFLLGPWLVQLADHAGLLHHPESHLMHALINLFSAVWALAVVGIALNGGWTQLQAGPPTGQPLLPALPCHCMQPHLRGALAEARVSKPSRLLCTYRAAGVDGGLLWWPGGMSICDGCRCQGNACCRADCVCFQQRGAVRRHAHQDR